MTQNRPIIHRTEGRRHGPITRLVSPSDLGELIKPFVFLDLIKVPKQRSVGPSNFGWHPHSGIATITIAFSGTGWYEDSTGKAGKLPAGSIEWMQAGGGVWHTGGPAPDALSIAGFQLWLALPAAIELAAPESLCIEPDAVPQIGPARVILGRYGAAVSPIPPVADLTYVQVTLKAGERWTYQPPPGHSVGWLAVCTGTLKVSGMIVGPEIAIFAPSEAAISVEAAEDTEFVLGSAVPHPHPLVLGYYSVHTNAAALAAGEANILAIQSRLKAGKQI